MFEKSEIVSIIALQWLISGFLVCYYDGIITSCRYVKQNLLIQHSYLCAYCQGGAVGSPSCAKLLKSFSRLSTLSCMVFVIET